MPRTIPSRLSKNRVRALASGDLAGIADVSGLPRDYVQALADDPRLLPDSNSLTALCLATSAHPESMLAFEPETTDVRQLLGREAPVQITILGAGNLGHTFAGLLPNRADVRVNMLVSTPERAQALNAALDAHGGIEVVSREGTVKGRPAKVSADPAEVIPGSQIILSCLPSFVEPDWLRRLAPHLDDDAWVGSIPGPGGFHWAARDIFRKAGKRAHVFGLAAIPWMCKSDEFGRRVRILGRKVMEGLATPSRALAPLMGDVLSALLGMPVLDIQNFLQIILNPGNQLLHPGLMYAMFRDFDGRPLPEPPLFYEGVSEEGAAVVEAMGDELLAIRDALVAARPELETSAVMPVWIAIQIAYGSDIVDGSSLRSILATNRAYAGIRTPMLKVDGGYVPNWGSRFFLEDIPYGLAVLKGLAELAAVPTPKIDEVTRWAQAKMPAEYVVGHALTGRDVPQSGAPQAYGLTTLEELFAAEFA